MDDVQCVYTLTAPQKDDAFSYISIFTNKFGTSPHYYL